MTRNQNLAGILVDSPETPSSQWPPLNMLHQTFNYALHFTGLHCVPLHYTSLHCTSLFCNSLFTIPLQHCSSLYCTALPFTALHCAALHCTALYCTLLHFTVLDNTAHCTALQYPELNCTALQSFWLRIGPVWRVGHHQFSSFMDPYHSEMDSYPSAVQCISV